MKTPDCPECGENLNREGSTVEAHVVPPNQTGATVSRQALVNFRCLCGAGGIMTMIWTAPSTTEAIG